VELSAVVSFVRRSGVVRLSTLVLLALLLPAAFGWLAPLERGLAAAMRLSPLPKVYMPVFIVCGALLPLGMRVLRRQLGAVRHVLDPYLLLLLGQLISELLVVLAGGKGLGVLVGLVFTLLRLVQLPLLWPMAARGSGLRLLLLLLAALWGWNAVQMLIWRWLPLL
jgi:hypothetical protein